MTPDQYRAALDELGLSQLGAGRWLGVSKRTLQRRAQAGAVPVAFKFPARNGACMFRRADVEALMAAAS